GPGVPVRRRLDARAAPGARPDRGRRGAGVRRVAGAAGGWLPRGAVGRPLRRGVHVLRAWRAGAARGLAEARFLRETGLLNRLYPVTNSRTASRHASCIPPVIGPGLP